MCLNTLGESTEWLYDFTIGYPGIKSTENPEDVYTIRGIFFLGHYPRNVHVHIRRYHTKDIPTQDAEVFSKWLHERWVEKDKMMEYFYKEGRFPTGQQLRRVDLPVQLNNSLVDLAQIWICLLPYIPIIKVLSTVYHGLFG